MISQAEFNFAKIFDENASQEDVFGAVCLPALQEIFSEKKKSALVFAYGVTNSGKTHTVIGKNLIAFTINLNLN